MIIPDFRHILCPSRVISFCFSIFPCFGLRKSLKIEILRFGVLCNKKCLDALLGVTLK